MCRFYQRNGTVDRLDIHLHPSVELQECEREAQKDGHSSALLTGLYTSYTAHLHRDKALLKRLLKV
jgi:hypothetical protein